MGEINGKPGLRLWSFEYVQRGENEYKRYSRTASGEGNFNESRQSRGGPTESRAPSDLMEFVRFDVGEVLRKEPGGHGPKILRLVVGNPLIMRHMAKAVPDAAACAPITILVDERADGVHLSHDLMAGLIASYESQSALAVAGDLDAKIESLLETAAR